MKSGNYDTVNGEIDVKVTFLDGARAVGQAIAINRFPLVVSWHRVIAGNGALGCYSSGMALKRYLLRSEGVYL